MPNTYEESETASAVKMATALNELARQYESEGTYGSGQTARTLREAAQLPMASLARLRAIIRAA